MPLDSQHLRDFFDELGEQNLYTNNLGKEPHLMGYDAVLTFQNAGYRAERGFFERFNYVVSFARMALTHRLILDEYAIHSRPLKLININALIYPNASAVLFLGSKSGKPILSFGLRADNQGLIKAKLSTENSFLKAFSLDESKEFFASFNRDLGTGAVLMISRNAPLTMQAGTYFNMEIL